MSNLMPGMSENDPHFNPGPEHEFEAERTCASCGQTSFAEITSTYVGDMTAVESWWCEKWDLDDPTSACGYLNETDIDTDDRDPDSARDIWLEDINK
jgi:hypothetical protein